MDPTARNSPSISSTSVPSGCFYDFGGHPGHEAGAFQECERRLVLLNLLDDSRHTDRIVRLDVAKGEEIRRSGATIAAARNGIAVRACGRVAKQSDETFFDLV